MSQNEVVIKVEDLSKQYRLGLIGTGTLSHDLNRWWAKVRGKEDPTLKLGSVNQLGVTGNDYVWALKDVNLEVRKGEVLGIIGKNGAGKSTLLKILSRITGPTTGKVKVKGQIASLLEVGTGFHPELTGKENIFLNGAILGMSKVEIKKKLDEIIEFSGVGGFIDTPVKRYSSGMYVRLAFAVAAHLDPEILIIDEVLAVGDAEFQKKCLGKMKEVASTGRTVLFVSHNMAAVGRLCPKSILLEAGTIKSYGPSNKIIETYIAGEVELNSKYVQASDSKKKMNLRVIEINPQDPDDTTSLRYVDPIVIGIEYEINEQVNNSTVWMGIKTSDGVMAFGACDYDIHEELLGVREVGYYKSEVVIPGKWLNSGQYNIIVGLIENNPITHYDRIDILNFVIDSVDTPHSLRRSGERSGVFQPFLEWSTNKVE